MSALDGGEAKVGDDELDSALPACGVTCSHRRRGSRLSCVRPIRRSGRPRPVKDRGPSRSHLLPREVQKHGNVAVGLVARLRDELDVMVEHPLPSGLEVVDTKKQTDSTRVLAADRIDLLLAVRLSQE